MQDQETSAKRLNWVAYTNLGLGVFSLVAWALPGPWAIRFFWQALDQAAAGGTDTFAVIVTGVMKVMAVLVVLCFWVFSGVSLVNGYLILMRRRHRLCLILSGLSALGTPLGLIVGVVSVIVLTQDGVRGLFADQSRVVASSGPLT